MHSPRRVIDDAFVEAVGRDPDLKRQWDILVDGNKDQLTRIRRAARKVNVEITIVLDLERVNEYLLRAAYAFHASGSNEDENWVDDCLLALSAAPSLPSQGSAPI